MRFFSPALSTALAAALLAGCGGNSTGSNSGLPNPTGEAQNHGLGAAGFRGMSACRLFPNPDSFYAPYTVNVSRYPVNSNSANYMATYRSRLHANFGYAPNTGIPINVVPRNQPLVSVSPPKKSRIQWMRLVGWHVASFRPQAAVRIVRFRTWDRSCRDTGCGETQPSCLP